MLFTEMEKKSSRSASCTFFGELLPQKEQIIQKPVLVLPRSPPIESSPHQMISDDTLGTQHNLFPTTLDPSLLEHTTDRGELVIEKEEALNVLLHHFLL